MVNGKLLVLGLCSLLGLASAREDDVRLRPDDVEMFAGQWTGTLEYLDYSDNRTRQKLAVSLTSQKSGEGLEYRFSYVEPNGKKVEGDTTRLTLQENGRKLKINEEEWRVADIKRDAGRKLEVVLTRQGMDNKKPAELRRSWIRARDTLTIRTEARTDKEEKSLVRNEYVLQKR